jgi:O-antigen/teichoic acid export membrane protein
MPTVRFESLTSIFSFGATSLFWLVVAFKFSPEDYGRIMQVQSLLLMLFSLFSLRTYDLSFYLQRTHALSDFAAFRWSIGIEIVMFTISVIVIVVSVSAGLTSGFDLPLAIPNLEVVLLAVAISSSVFQGSTQALLRSHHRDIGISIANLTSGLAFISGVVIVLLSLETGPGLILAIWAAGTAARSLPLIALVLWSGRVGSDESPTTEGGARQGLSRAARWSVLRFLVVGQLANVVKSNTLAIETLLLGGLASDNAVAVFRIARSILNVMVVVLNVVYQRAFRDLRHVQDATKRSVIFRAIERRSLVTSLATAPLCILGTAAFVLLNPAVEYRQLYVVVPLMILATLPVAMQQSRFAFLSLTARFLKINLAYVAGISALATLSFIFQAFLSPALYVFLLFLSNLVRMLIMQLLSRESAVHPKPERLNVE